MPPSCAALALALVACRGNEAGPPANPTPAACDPDDAGLTLPPGFCATTFADLAGAPRHVVVSPTGDVYVTLSGGPVVALRDTNADGHADLIALDGAGNLFVAIGSAGNMCAANADPCPELDTRAGIWRFSATGLDQAFTPAARFARGLRNAVGLAMGLRDGVLYAVQHGRDNLQSFPALFDLDAAAENPAEELLAVAQGDDFGWPYCYYDVAARARVLAPEYGGDRATRERCAATRMPRAVFPGHWAPNALVFHPGTGLPARYAGGAFIAFHGSWNRAPRPQAGFRVVFVPASSGGAPGTAWETFADGFAGLDPVSDPADAAHRPTGLAVGPPPDGALFVTDDAGGRIYRIVYRGN